MRCKACRHATVVASLGILTMAGLAGCAKTDSQRAQAVRANLTTATPAATVALPSGHDGQGVAQASPRIGARYPQNAAWPRFAQVVAVQPLSQSETTSSPRRVCRNEQVAFPETYRDNHQISDGRGRTLATLAGSAGGAIAGHRIQKDHQQDNRSSMQMLYVCRTVNDTARSVQTLGYDVTYIMDGRTGHIRMHHDTGVGVGLPVRNGVVVAGVDGP